MSKWRELIISILGFVTPYIFLFSYYFLTDTIEKKILPYILFFKDINFYIPHFPISNYIFLSVIGLFFIITLFSISLHLSEKPIFYRKKVIALIMFLITTILSLFFAKDDFIFHLSLLFIPFSFFFASYMIKIKKLFISEIMYIILFGVWLYNYLGY